MIVEAPTILANTDYTKEFRLRCFWRDPGVLLKPSKMATQKLVVQWRKWRMNEIIQINKDHKLKIFLN